MTRYLWTPEHPYRKTSTGTRLGTVAAVMLSGEDGHHFLLFCQQQNSRTFRFISCNEDAAQRRRKRQQIGKTKEERT
ncbi:MAG TPA: hypothetical protein H9733_03510 [Candidatus Anaerotignum merdipullorum]|nr:hypothetical protein [Candidatus Anaerotignum merdipullorum]